MDTEYLTDEERAQLALCDAATAGKWEAGIVNRDGSCKVYANGRCDTWDGLIRYDIIRTEETDSTDGEGRNFWVSGSAQANAAMIAAARLGWPETLRRLAEARARLAQRELELMGVVLTYEPASYPAEHCGQPMRWRDYHSDFECVVCGVRQTPHDQLVALGLAQPYPVDEDDAELRPAAPGEEVNRG